ncbi:hypothetical protein HCN44_004758 [Aphidius gifuensis]|uniref:DNA topoisomerase n=1 Tax=Aphidius gifuensis TaxID=684658 RepID=A0A834XJC6_APHGI|nr:hypothetical protein HCN44_004758 [Aphidius gifuensis]
MGQKFKPTKIDLIEKQTLPPSLLNEVQLLDLMNEHGIGTRTTYANSIQKVIDNNYAKFKNNKYFIPTKLGLGIVQAYKTINLTNFITPKLQKDINKNIIYICQGIKTPEQVLKSQIDFYKKNFKILSDNIDIVDEILNKYFNFKINKFYKDDLIFIDSIIKSIKNNDN